MPFYVFIVFLSFLLSCFFTNRFPPFLILDRIQPLITEQQNKQLWRLFLSGPG